MQPAVEGDKGTVGVDGIAVVHYPASLTGLGGMNGVAVFNNIYVTLIVKMVAHGASNSVDSIERESGYRIALYCVAA